MRGRRKIPRGKSKKIFRKGAMRRHPRNVIAGRPMRGGIRL